MLRWRIEENGGLAGVRFGNKRYVPVLNEMRLRLDLTRNQPNAAATMAPLNVAKAGDRGEPPVGVAVRVSDWRGTARRQRLRASDFRRQAYLPVLLLSRVICNGKTDIIAVASATRQKQLRGHRTRAFQFARQQVAKCRSVQASRLHLLRLWFD